NPTNLH
uniref:Trypsin-modulating oostatic factor n=1 Tax=Sarcophaga bullata TaxID=7385 RepID=TMOF_SARBU|nr:RecName: Full=Trypsin-modulating oostatic factor; Short=TMOF [Sarcophaga bullata]